MGIYWEYQLQSPGLAFFRDSRGSGFFMIRGMFRGMLCACDIVFLFN